MLGPTTGHTIASTRRCGRGRARRESFNLKNFLCGVCGCVPVTGRRCGMSEPFPFFPVFCVFFCFRVCLFLILSRLRAELARNGCRLAISPCPRRYIYINIHKRRKPANGIRTGACLSVFLFFWRWLRRDYRFPPSSLALTLSFYR
jgi:hypothetical protein